MSVASKGIALTTQAIVLLALAVIVLSATIIFFMNASNPAERTIISIADQTTLCQQYIRLDAKCEDTSIVFDRSDSEAARELLQALAETCGGLGFSDLCSGDEASSECVRQCCATFCG